MRAGIVGVGFMSWIHYLAYPRSETAQMAAFSSRDAGKRSGDWRGVKGNFGPPGEQIDISEMNVYDSLDAMLEDETLDLIDICLPPKLHPEAIEKCLAAGKHVLCEKPLALDYGEAQSMAQAAKKHNAITMVPFTYSFLPMAQTIKRLLNEGYLGSPYHLNFRYNANYGRSPEYSWRFDRKHAGSGSLGDIGSHFIYLSVWFFGAVTHVSSDLCTFVERPDIDPLGQPYVSADDFSIIVLTFSNGAKGVIQASTVAHEPTPWGQTHYFDLHGSKGTLRGWTDWENTYKLIGAKQKNNNSRKLRFLN